MLIPASVHFVGEQEPHLTSNPQWILFYEREMGEMRHQLNSKRAIALSFLKDSSDGGQVPIQLIKLSVCWVPWVR